LSVLLADKSALEWLPVSEAVIDRALEVQGLLSARRGNGRRRPVTDLMIAATAELHGAAAVLHVDSDYDMIADDPAPSPGVFDASAHRSGSPAGGRTPLCCPRASTHGRRGACRGRRLSAETVPRADRLLTELPLDFFPGWCRVGMGSFV
jgi:hypothetical protein